ncbi:MAG: hypothetical protein VYA80_01825 [Pseudomonadota bacterium]|nr:hypothetical protein [Pseudomonadota bacterium]
MDKSQELADRLVKGLEKLSSIDIPKSAEKQSGDFSLLANKLNQAIHVLPGDIRRLIHTADTGFASNGEWVNENIKQQNIQIEKLARAAKMVSIWLSSEGAEVEKNFIIRGNIRGWAHVWRKEEKGTAKIESDLKFIEFAKDCLSRAGINDNQTERIDKALGSDWRTAEHP